MSHQSVRQHRYEAWLAAIILRSMAMPAPVFAQAPDVGESHCVYNCDDSSSSGGNSGGGGGWEAGSTWQMLFGSSAEHAQQRQQQGNALNKQANTAFTNGDYATAVKLYREALRLYPHSKIAENLRNAEAKLKEQQDQAAAARREAQERAAREREEKQRDAKVAANIRHDIVGPLADKLQRMSAGLDFDQSGMSTSVASAGGLDFMPTATMSPPASAAPVMADSSVVDLRDATTLIVDPARVKGPSTEPAVPPTNMRDLRDALADLPQKTAPRSLYEADAEDIALLFPELQDPAFQQTVSNVLAADARGDVHAADQALAQLDRWWKPDAQQLQAMHARSMADVKTLESDSKYKPLVQKMRESVRQWEATSLNMADQQAQQETRELLRRAPPATAQTSEQRGQWFLGEVQAISERARQRQAETLHKASAEFQAEVQRLKEERAAEHGQTP